LNMSGRCSKRSMSQSTRSSCRAPSSSSDMPGARPRPGKPHTQSLALLARAGLSPAHPGAGPQRPVQQCRISGAVANAAATATHLAFFSARSREGQLILSWLGSFKSILIVKPGPF
jgi:hypothetical protein